MDGETILQMRSVSNCTSYDHEKRLSMIIDESGIVDVSKRNKVGEKEDHAFMEWLRKKSDRIGYGKYKLR